MRVIVFRLSLEKDRRLGWGALCSEARYLSVCEGGPVEQRQLSDEAWKTVVLESNLGYSGQLPGSSATVQALVPSAFRETAKVWCVAVLLVEPKPFDTLTERLDQILRDFVVSRRGADS